MVSAALTTILVLLQMAPAEHAPPITARSVETTLFDGDDTRRVGLGPNETAAIEIAADIREILIVDPDIVKVVPRSIRQVYFVGVTVGKTKVLFYDVKGVQIAAFDVWVSESRSSSADERDPITDYFLHGLRFGE
jgi:Flp pilus assembly secretin CpaC